jgi:peptidyl-prolyl cis-trans isomerase A (cyclophilin A)
MGCLAVGLMGEAFAQTPPPAPKVTITTNMGAIEITLDPVAAPKTSAHMLRLFKSGHYTGAAIFRVEPGFLIQLGDLDAQLTYRRPPVGTVPLETAKKHARGTVALARGDDPNSGQSSFYFDLADNKHLNADPNAPPNTTGYAVFAQVTGGMEVLEAIEKVAREPNAGPFPGALPKAPIVVKRVVVE